MMKSMAPTADVSHGRADGRPGELATAPDRAAAIKLRSSGGAGAGGISSEPRRGLRAVCSRGLLGRQATERDHAVVEPAAASAATAEPASPAEPVMIDVWRPGRRSDEARPPRRERRPHRRDRPAQGAAPAPVAAEGDAAAPVPTGDGEGHRRPHHSGRPPRRDRAIAAGSGRRPSAKARAGKRSRAGRDQRRPLKARPRRRSGATRHPIRTHPSPSLRP